MKVSQETKYGHLSRSVMEETKVEKIRRAQTGGVTTELLEGQKAIYVADKVIIRDFDAEEDDANLDDEQKAAKKKQRQ